MVDVAIVVTTFVMIFPAELPDKTFIATLVLATRFGRRWVWLGTAAAFLVQVLIAVLAGGLLALAPALLVSAVTLVLFTVGSVIMFRGGLRSRAEELRAARATHADELTLVDAKGASIATERPLRVMAVSFAVLFTAEWGDLSQIMTAGLAARTNAPLSVFLGSWTALCTVAALAVLTGRWLRVHMPIWRVRLVSGTILAALAVWTLLEMIPRG